MAPGLQTASSAPQEAVCEQAIPSGALGLFVDSDWSQALMASVLLQSPTQGATGLLKDENDPVCKCPMQMGETEYRAVTPAAEEVLRRACRSNEFKAGC